jgi:hypothetical protein
MTINGVLRKMFGQYSETKTTQQTKDKTVTDEQLHAGATEDDWATAADKDTFATVSPAVVSTDTTAVLAPSEPITVEATPPNGADNSGQATEAQAATCGTEVSP